MIGFPYTTTKNFRIVEVRLAYRKFSFHDCFVAVRHCTLQQHLVYQLKDPSKKNKWKLQLC